MTDGWRTVLIESFEKLSLCDGCLTAEGEETLSVPLSQLRCVMLTSDRGSITVPLLTALSENGVSLILCDGKKDPVSELLPLAAHSSAAGRLRTQCEWTAERKDELWQAVVRTKLNAQLTLLRLCGCPVPEELEKYRLAVLPGDESNREGQAARVYFSSLFGENFIRHTEDAPNAALNYGYTILRSAVTRLLTAHGYHTALGIHHCNQYNRFNLACDLMEPFRPFVDRVVFAAPGRELDREYKIELISVLNSPCTLEGRSTTVETAAEQFALAALRAMESSGEVLLPEVGFDGAAQCDPSDV